MVRSKYQNCPGSSWLLLRKGALRRENALDCCFRDTQIRENVPSDGGIDQKIRQGMDTLKIFFSSSRILKYLDRAAS